MDPQKLPNGRLLVPRRAEGPDGMVGDGMDEIGPDDPGYADWLDWIENPGLGHRLVGPWIETMVDGRTELVRYCVDCGAGVVNGCPTGACRVDQWTDPRADEVM